MKLRKGISLALAGACAVLMLTGCANTDAPVDSEVVDSGSSSVVIEEENFESRIDEVTLDEAGMEASLRKLAEGLQENLKANDENAVVEFRVNEDGTCAFWAAGTNDDGTVAELSIIKEAETIRDCFKDYLDAGFFDIEGNILGLDVNASGEGAVEDEATIENEAEIEGESEAVVEGEEAEEENAESEAAEGEAEAETEDEAETEAESEAEDESIETEEASSEAAEG